jgi:hypothetical protein
MIRVSLIKDQSLSDQGGGEVGTSWGSNLTKLGGERKRVRGREKERKKRG